MKISNDLNNTFEEKMLWIFKRTFVGLVFFVNESDSFVALQVQLSLCNSRQWLDCCSSPRNFALLVCDSFFLRNTARHRFYWRNENCLRYQRGAPNLVTLFPLSVNTDLICLTPCGNSRFKLSCYQKMTLQNFWATPRCWFCMKMPITMKWLELLAAAG